MIIQLILLVAILLVLRRLLIARNSSKTKAWKKIIAVVILLVAVVFICFPNALNEVAKFVGVGRGADLVLYGLVIAFMYEQVNGYIKDREQEKQIVVLARKIALIEANKRNL
jgi:hypothetical protein